MRSFSRSSRPWKTSALPDDKKTVNRPARGSLRDTRITASFLIGAVLLATGAGTLNGEEDRRPRSGKAIRRRGGGCGLRQGGRLPIGRRAPAATRSGCVLAIPLHGPAEQETYLPDNQLPFGDVLDEEED